MGKNKLEKFADMASYPHVFEYPYSAVDNVPFEMKGNWHQQFFKNDNPIVLELGCGNDYENEKEDFEVDEADTVELINGERMPWEQVKRDGIDYIALYYVNEKRATGADSGCGTGMSTTGLFW